MRPPRTQRSPPPSLSAKLARTRSGCSRASHDMPKSSPTSSSAVSASRTSPGGRTPSRASEANATAAAATWPFMSSAPRPQTSPSTRSPDHGSRGHSSGSASTVSVWAISRRLGPSPPGRRATRFARSGVFATSSLATPLSARYRCSSVGRPRLVPGRVDGVEAQELLEELRHLLAERHTGFGLRPGRELVPDVPELGEDDRLHEPAEHLDRRPLRADDAVADHPRDDAVVADPPLLAPLVELDQRLREAVERVVVAPLARRAPRARAPPRGGARGTPARAAAAPRAAPRQPGESNPLPCPSTLRISWYSQGESSSSMSSWSMA